MTNIEQKAREAAYKAAWDAGYEGRETSAWDDFNTLDVPMGDPDDAQVVVDHKRSIDAAINAYRDSLTVPEEVENFIEQFPEINMGNYNDDNVYAVNQWGIEAIDMLRHQAARIAEIGAENKRLKNTLQLHADDVCSLNDEVDLMKYQRDYADERATAAEAEIERLRAENRTLRNAVIVSDERATAVLAERDRLRKEIASRCEHCGGTVSSYGPDGGCPGCGAPQCCKSCCDRQNEYDRAIAAEAERDALKALVVRMRTELIEARREFLPDLPEDGVHRCSIDVTLSLTPADLAGCVVVPREPTKAMLRAAQDAWLNDPARRSSTLWRAMLDAALAANSGD